MCLFVSSLFNYKVLCGHLRANKGEKTCEDEWIHTYRIETRGLCAWTPKSYYFLLSYPIISKKLHALAQIHNEAR